MDHNRGDNKYTYYGDNGSANLLLGNLVDSSQRKSHKSVDYYSRHADGILVIEQKKTKLLNGILSCSSEFIISLI